MAQAVEGLLGSRISDGWINIQDGAACRLKRIRLHESGHPVPDERGEAGARKILEIAQQSGERDLLICLISGGASALMPLPAGAGTLAQKKEMTRALLACGATIHEINTVRKHISGIKGGQLASAAFPATVLALILSDVVGDDLSVIGSGPLTPDQTTCADTKRILEKYGIACPPLYETPKPGDKAFRKVSNILVGSNAASIEAAARKAKELGYQPLILSTFVEGETREIARMHAAIAKEIAAHGRPARPPVCVLSGGETTVTIRGKGLGGRNLEFVLACAIALEGVEGVTVFSGGTDGRDGPTDAAGAVADSATLDRARKMGMEPQAYLNDNNSYTFFERAGGLIKTGPTGTNVMDIRVLLVLPRAR